MTPPPLEAHHIIHAARMYNHKPCDESLQFLLDQIQEYFQPPPEHTCHWCGVTDSENEKAGFGPLTDISVMTANGEEGYAHALRWACQTHLVTITAALVELGFGVHRHGGINYLEPEHCPGYSTMTACPTPETDE